ncbi:MAG: substrate-binding domain-containing protein [Chitinophagaceae bacterium]|nr:substrate-binding domain-containing protein [Chitinophagaceae bacterium]
MDRNQYPGLYRWIGSLLLLLAMAACNDGEKKAGFTDSPKQGTINISVDESFRPVIEEEIRVYEALFPGTRINAAYKPEASCFKDLFSDTMNRMIIVTRGLNKEEARFYNDSLGFTPVSDRIAADAITVVVNKGSTDTLFTLNRLEQQLSGKLGSRQLIVFDGLNATSTVRYAVDSLLHGAAFDSSVVRAVRNSAEVLDYVAANPDAIGLVGISWIGNPEDTAQVNLLKKIKIAYLECIYCADSPYVKPTQASIISRRYPLVRGLYYILKENYNGLGSGFASFLKYQKGQLIFRRAYLAPVMDFGIRDVKINEKL